MEAREVLRSLEAEGVLSGLRQLRSRRWSAAVEPGNIRRLAERMGSLKAHFSALTCIDLGDRFELIYHFDLEGELVNVSTLVPKALPALPSIADIHPPADFYEREVAEMFGVKFEGAPRSGRLLLPEDWPPGEYPLRRW
ncbi:MAG: NADH-quinone oxidoreductase subunit C [Thermofilum sp.]